MLYSHNAEFTGRSSEAYGGPVERLVIAGDNLTLLAACCAAPAEPQPDYGYFNGGTRNKTTALNTYVALDAE